MKYIAIMTENKPKTLEVSCNSNDLQLHPIHKPVLVLENGQYFYIKQRWINHIVNYFVERGDK